MSEMENMQEQEVLETTEEVVEEAAATETNDASEPETTNTEETEAKLAGNGRILLRKSGTEPLVRVMVEAQTEELCREYAESVAQVIRDKGYEQ